uniref:Uncharacterized protein n=1 Tax=Onchocerca volvulus TaxID=6282 RepID=A0A8R1Y5W0_ONCVO
MLQLEPTDELISSFSLFCYLGFRMIHGTTCPEKKKKKLKIPLSAKEIKLGCLKNRKKTLIKGKNLIGLMLLKRKIFVLMWIFITVLLIVASVQIKQNEGKKVLFEESDGHEHIEESDGQEEESDGQDSEDEDKSEDDKHEFEKVEKDTVKVDMFRMEKLWYHSIRQYLNFLIKQCKSSHFPGKKKKKKPQIYRFCFIVQIPIISEFIYSFSN